MAARTRRAHPDAALHGGHGTPAAWGAVTDGRNPAFRGLALPHPGSAARPRRNPHSGATRGRAPPDHRLRSLHRALQRDWTTLPHDSSSHDPPRFADRGDAHRPPRGGRDPAVTVRAVGGGPALGPPKPAR